MPIPELAETYTLDSEPKSEEALPEAGTSTGEDQDISTCNTMITSGWVQQPISELVHPKTKDQPLMSRL